MLKAAAVVIWYNPENLGQNIAIKNILSYFQFFKKVYIIDNSTNDNTNLASQIPNSQYIPNFNNFGIAKALNQGCEAAMIDNFTWVMTMDQDSRWELKELSLYLSQIENKIQEDDNIISFSPDTINNQEKKSSLKIIKDKFLKRKSCPDFHFSDRVLTSGNFLNINAWNKIGKFNEELFIDDVDYDFCYRLIQNNYKILKINKVNMIHSSGGEVKKTFFPHAYWYHKERIYYITRNKMFIIREYPEFAHKYKYKQAIIRIFFEKLFLMEFSDLKYAIKGFFDGKNNKLGKYNFSIETAP